MGPPSTPSLERACMVDGVCEGMTLALAAAEAALAAEAEEKEEDDVGAVGNAESRGDRTTRKFAVVERPVGYRRDAQGRRLRQKCTVVEMWGGQNLPSARPLRPDLLACLYEHEVEALGVAGRRIPVELQLDAQDSDTLQLGSIAPTPAAPTPELMQAPAQEDFEAVEKPVQKTPTMTSPSHSVPSTAAEQTATNFSAEVDNPAAAAAAAAAARRQRLHDAEREAERDIQSIRNAARRPPESRKRPRPPSSSSSSSASGASMTSMSALQPYPTTVPACIPNSPMPYLLKEWPSLLKSRSSTHFVPPPTARTSNPRCILYYCRTTPRIIDNCALSLALWLGRRLRLPVLAVLLVRPALYQTRQESHHLPNTTAAYFERTAFHGFADTLHNKLGVATLLARCDGRANVANGAATNAADVNGKASQIMLQIVRGYRAHCLVTDGFVEAHASSWPPTKIWLKHNRFPAPIFAVDSNALTDKLRDSAKSLAPLTSPSLQASLKRVHNFREKVVKAAATKWRTQKQPGYHSEILKLGVGALRRGPSSSSFPTFCPDVQMPLFVQDTTAAIFRKIKASRTTFIPSEVYATPWELTFLSLEQLNSGGDETSAISDTGSMHGSEAHALRALHQFCTGAAHMTDLRERDFSTQQVGPEQVAAFLRVGSLSPRILADVLLGGRVSNLNPEFSNAHLPMRWMLLLAAQTPGQRLDLNSAWPRPHGRENVQRLMDGMVEAPYAERAAASKLLDRARIMTAQQQRQQQMMVQQQQQQQQRQQNCAAFGLDHMWLWRRLAPLCLSHPHSTFVYAAPENTFGVSTRMLPGDIERGRTPDRTFNAIQWRLREEGSMHPLLMPYWVGKLKLWRRKPFLAFDLALGLLWRYMCGALIDPDGVILAVAHEFFPEAAHPLAASASSSSSVSSSTGAGGDFVDGLDAPVRAWMAVHPIPDSDSMVEKALTRETLDALVARSVRAPTTASH